MQYLKVKGLNISKLTLGTVQLGMEYGIANKSGKPDFKTSFRLLQAAVDGGVNSFDTAEGYGDSEAVLGNYLSSETCNIRRPVISTKFEIIPEESISSAKVEKQIYRFMEQSLQRLKISRIPIYMHNPRDMTKYGKIVPETMGKLKREGLIEKAGVSVYTSVDIDGMLKEDVYDVVQLPMNILDQRLIKSGSIKKLLQADMVIFVRSIFLQGLLFVKPEELPKNLKCVEGQLKRLGFIAQREGSSIAQLALAYMRDMEGIASLVIGAETPEQVMENIKLMNAPPIREKTRDEIMKLFDDIPEEVLNPTKWQKT